MAEEILDVVDENDNVIGQEPRSKIHREGLFHREVHVLFITPNKEIIFQKRGINKDSYPGLLDATVGGHVSQGETYETAALKEMEEETGIKATIDQLVPCSKITNRSLDVARHHQNNCHRMVFGYVYAGGVDDLQIEGGDGGGAGFQAIAYDDIMRMTDAEQHGIIKSFVREPYHGIYRQLLDMVK